MSLEVVRAWRALVARVELQPVPFDVARVDDYVMWLNDLDLEELEPHQALYFSVEPNDDGHPYQVQVAARCGSLMGTTGVS